MKKLIAAAILSLFTLAACTTLDPYTGEEETAKATTGAAIGAATGAAAGAAAGDAEGALAGAAAGAAIGGGIGYYMDQQEEELRRRLEGTGVRVQRQGDQINLIMPGNVTFATNQTTIQPQFTNVLESVGLVLKEYDKTAIRVEGHTDSRGSASYNQLLSEQRAQSVADFLINQGIAPRRVQATGYGESQPIASNETEAGRQQNRRVELKLIPQEQ